MEIKEKTQAIRNKNNKQLKQQTIKTTNNGNFKIHPRPNRKS
jgi:hypothetical protein